VNEQLKVLKEEITQSKQIIEQLTQEKNISSEAQIQLQ
jgi:hypothetical protein